MSEISDLADEQYCYLTTTGRVSGKPHEIEIWFALNRATLYMLSGGGAKSDWVRNIRRNPAVSVRIGNRTFDGAGHVLDPTDSADPLARRLLFDKYSAGYSGSLVNWRESALPVAVHLDTGQDRD